MVWAPDYITVAEYNAWSRVGDTVDDVETTVWITAASRAIDAHCERQFGSIAAAGARVYRRGAYWDPDLELYVQPIDDVQDATGMTVAGVAFASSGAVLLPDNALVNGRPYEAIGVTSCPVYPLTVVAKYGWTAVPTQVKGACRLQTSRFITRRDSPYGIAGTPDAGSELRLQAKVDPDVAVALRGLGRLGVPG